MARPPAIAVAAGRFRFCAAVVPGRTWSVPHARSLPAMESSSGGRGSAWRNCRGGSIRSALRAGGFDQLRRVEVENGETAPVAFTVRVTGERQHALAAQPPAVVLAGVR